MAKLNSRVLEGIDTEAIERELDSLGYTQKLKTQAQRLDESSWNLDGNEPSPTLFTDLGEPSDFWKAALKDSKLARFAQPTRTRTRLTLGALRYTPKGFEAEIEIHQKGPRSCVRVQVPADAGLRQLLYDGRTGRPPVLPFPLAVLTQEGAELSLICSGEELEAAADTLGARKTLPLWNPETKTYDLIGTAKLVSLTLVGVDVSIYGDIQVRYLPGYEIGRLRAGPPRYRIVSSREDRPLVATLGLKQLLAGPAFFAPLKQQLALALAP